MNYRIPSDAHVWNDTGHIVDHNDISDSLAASLGINALFYGADPTGSGDSTAALNNAMSAAANTRNRTLTIPAGTYSVSGPLLPAGVLIRGAKGGTQSGNDAPSPKGTIIRPSASWDAGGRPVSGVFTLLGNTATGTQFRDMWIDGRDGPAGLDGIAGFGAVSSVSLRNTGIYMPPANGISSTDDGSDRADGWHMDTVIVQKPGNHGVSGRYTDGTLVNVHCQSGTGTGNGFDLTGGGNTRLIGCRADLCNYGFNIEVASGGGFNDCVSLIGCGTQRNEAYGLRAGNSGASGTSPVLVVGGSFDEDGVNGGSGGGGYSAIRAAGLVTLILTGVNCMCGTVDVAGGCPQYALSTAAVSGHVPQLVQAVGGVWNSIDSSLVSNGAPATLLSYSVHGYSGGMYLGTTATPLTIKQSNPL